MEPSGITCKCGRFVAFKPCLSDVNGNKGRLVAVCNGPNAQGESCRTIRWKKSSTSPSSSPPLNSPPPVIPAPLPQALEPAGSLPPAMGGSVFATTAPPGTPQCPTRGCGQTRIAPDCQRRLCRKHCVSNGGCTSKTHTGPRSATTRTGPPSLPPAAIQPGRVRVPTPPLLPTAASSHDGQTLTTSPPNANVQVSPDVDVLDALPNPRFRSHMPPIFTSQWKKEQELVEEKRRVECERKLCAAQVKHTVIVYAWTEDSKPATVEEFQEGPLAFTWPYFPLSASVLSALSLAGSATRVQLYRQALGTWVNVNVGHVIELKEGARVFLKPSHVVDYPDFDGLLKPESTPHLRYKLTEERRELRDRYRSKGKASGKGRVGDASTSSSEDGGNNNEKPPPSQRHFRKQTLPPSFFQPSPSPLEAANDIIELSSDDCSSGPSQAVRKRRASNQDSPSPRKRRNNVGLYIHDSSPVIELTDDSDSSPPPSTAVAVKVEPSSSDAFTVTPQWPADFYAIDILTFFGACEKNSSTRTETIFHEYFPNTPYRRSTVNENRLRWKKAPQNLRDNVLRAKRTDDGKWSVFQKSTRNNGKR